MRSGDNALDVKRTIFITIIFSFVGFSGCHLENPEQKGDAEAKAGRFESAIYWYESALGSEDRSAIHQKMAEIFANKLRDPASAAYHYRRILALHTAVDAPMRQEQLCTAWRGLHPPRKARQAGLKTARHQRQLLLRSRLLQKAKKRPKAKCALTLCRLAIPWSQSRKSSTRRLRAGKIFSMPTRTSCRIPMNSR
jgi:hypothetical protein